jgi:hypothetical protein
MFHLELRDRDVSSLLGLGAAQSHLRLRQAGPAANARPLWAALSQCWLGDWTGGRVAYSCPGRLQAAAGIRREDGEP